jgi:hypothetical protein
VLCLRTACVSLLRDTQKDSETIMILMICGPLYATAQEASGHSRSSRLRINQVAFGGVRVVHMKNYFKQNIGKYF